MDHNQATPAERTHIPAISTPSVIHEIASKAKPASAEKIYNLIEGQLRKRLGTLEAKIDAQTELIKSLINTQVK